LEEKGDGFQVEAHHPNREARGWQHHVVAVLCCREDWCNSQKTGALHKIDGIMREENYVDILKQHLKTSVKAWSQMGLLNGQ
jgi:hypothetical protein